MFVIESRHLFKYLYLKNKKRSVLCYVCVQSVCEEEAQIAGERAGGRKSASNLSKKRRKNNASICLPSRGNIDLNMNVTIYMC